MKYRIVQDAGQYCFHAETFINGRWECIDSSIRHGKSVESVREFLLKFAGLPKEKIIHEEFEL